MIDLRFSEEHARRKRVSVNGRDRFEILFFERSIHDDLCRHAVTDLRVLEECAETLSATLQQLTDPRFGWQDWCASPATLRRVKLKDLGTKILGIVTHGVGNPNHWEPYLVLNVRPFDSSRVAAMSRRRATIAHEMTHLLQFETAAYRHWPNQGQAGAVLDPNWWLHEAAALAVEAAMSEDSPEYFPMLWDWALSPSRSLFVDDSGSFGAAFLMYLMRTLPVGNRLPAELYRVDPAGVANMSGGDMLDHVLRSHGTQLAAVTGKECFASGYCVDAAFLGTANSVLDPRIRDVVGSRCVADVFDRFPIQQAASQSSVDRLGCRYFHFRLPLQSECLSVRVKPLLHDGMTALRAELVLVGRDGQKLQQLTLARDEQSHLLTAEVAANFHDVEYVLLVVAHCAWSFRVELDEQSDLQTFEISAEVR